MVERWTENAPSEHVLAAFGEPDAIPQRLGGGQGRAWSAGRLVLKPIDDLAEATWVGEVLSGLAEDGFRINRPVRTRTGTWTVDGWSAWEALAGEHDRSGRWTEILHVAERLNVALGGLARPAFLDSRTHAWAAADRMAWDEQPVEVVHDRLRPLAERVSTHVRPDHSSSQVIHGDLAGNVLFAPGRPPAVIDFTPYWRPRRFCLAVVVVDALLWHDAPSSLVDAVRGADRTSLLARAALYRLITSDRLAEGEEPAAADASVRAAARDHGRVLALLDRSAS